MSSHNIIDYQEEANKLYKGYALAPMVRASTTPLRVLALRYGADFVYSEELVDRSISDTIRVQNDKLQTIDYIKDTSKLPLKTQRKLQRQNNRPCLILRIDQQIEKQNSSEQNCSPYCLLRNAREGGLWQSEDPGEESRNKLPIPGYSR